MGTPKNLGCDWRSCPTGCPDAQRPSGPGAGCAPASPARVPLFLTIITTLTDRRAYRREDLATLYGFRRHAELDIRHRRGSARETAAASGLHPGRPDSGCLLGVLLVAFPA